MLAKTKGERVAEDESLLDGITDSVNMNLSKLPETQRTKEAGMLQSTGLQRVGHDLAMEQQQQTLCCQNSETSVSKFKPSEHLTSRRSPRHSYSTGKWEWRSMELSPLPPAYKGGNQMSAESRTLSSQSAVTDQSRAFIWGRGGAMRVTSSPFLP